MPELTSAWGPPPPAGRPESPTDRPERPEDRPEPVGDRRGPPGALEPPAERGQARVWLLAAGVTALVVVLMAGGLVAAAQLWSAGAERQMADEVETRREAENRPELRDVAPVSVLGPTWEAGADTYPMAFPDWPFAFRTPRSWNCFRGTFDEVPEAEAWACTDGMDFDTPPKAGVLLWECPTTCADDEQQQMVETWLDQPEEAVQLDDPPVTYVETEPDQPGNYRIDLSLFAADPDAPGTPLRWHVGVFAEARSDQTRDDVLKIVNDIVSQASWPAA